MKGGGVAGMLVAAILATILVFVIADLAGGIGDFPNERWAGAIAMVCLAAWIGPGALARYRGNSSALLQTIVIWLALACAAGLLFVYFRDDLTAMDFNV